MEKPLEPIVRNCEPLPEFHREFLCHTLEQINTKIPAFEKHTPEPLFRAHAQNHAIAALIAKDLPDATQRALRAFFDGSGPPVLVLHNFPITSHDAKADSKTDLLLTGLGYTAGMGYRDDPKQTVAIDDKDHMTPGKYMLEAFQGTGNQPFHQDVEQGGHIAALVCTKGGVDTITTDFTRLERLKGKHHSQLSQSDAAQVEQVTLKDGDIVLFRDFEVFHARHDHLGTFKNDGDRNLRYIELGYFQPAHLPEGWTGRVAQEAENMMKPRTK